MEFSEIIGLTAGILTSAAAVPQLLKTWRSKDATDVSMKMFIVLVTGIALWVVYGFMVSDMPIILTNILALILNGLMVYFKIRFR